MGGAVGLAVLQYLQAHGLVEASARMGDYMLQRLKSLCDLPAVGDVRGLGLMAGVELVADQKSQQPFPLIERIAERVQSAALTKGVNVYFGTGLADGVNGDAILLGPPFIISELQIDAIVAVLREATTNYNMAKKRRQNPSP